MLNFFGYAYEDFRTSTICNQIFEVTLLVFTNEAGSNYFNVYQKIGHFLYMIFLINIIQHLQLI